MARSSESVGIVTVFSQFIFNFSLMLLASLIMTAPTIFVYLIFLKEFLKIQLKLSEKPYISTTLFSKMSKDRLISEGRRVFKLFSEARKYLKP